MESAIVASDKGSTTLLIKLMSQDYSMIDGLFQNTRISKGGTPLPTPPSSEPVRASEKVNVPDAKSNKPKSGIE